MLRATVLVSGLVMAVTLGIGTAGPVTAAAAAESAPAQASARTSAQAVLARAESFATGDLAASSSPRRSTFARLVGSAHGSAAASGPGKRSRVDGTLVLRDLYRVADDLTGEDRERADQILARPTDGAADQYGDGYASTSERACTTHVCIHWSPTSTDAPPNRAWVTKNLKVVSKVWAAEVDKLGYRAPLPDGNRGGDDRFDVYLKDLGSTGAYGYCTPDGSASGSTSAAYCVFDNDFSPAQYGGVAATKSLKVTAAHEFFHAVQFAYDYREDPWFMESTAVWMEERVAGGINDNRQYLPYGQLVDPAGSLDHFEGNGFTQYGNWVWWEYLSERFGTGIVKDVWAQAAGRGDYSVKALRQVLVSRGGLGDVFAQYAAATTDAPAAYPEGRKWPAATTAGLGVLTAVAPTATTNALIDHLASSSYVYSPDAATLGARTWKLRVKVRTPGRATSPAVAIRVTKVNGSVVDRSVTLDRRGRGAIDVAFGAQRVQRVTVTMANASTRYRCGRGSVAYSCQGEARDDGAPFVLRVKAFQR